MDKVYQEQYENYVGRCFHHKDNNKLVYTFGRIEDERVQIHDKGEDTISYELEEALGLIRDNIWIVID